MLKKELSNLFKTLLIACLIMPSFATADVNQAVAYLKSQTQDAWTTQALAAAGESGMNLDHLKSVSGTLATDYAKAILALSAAAEDPSAYGNIDYVAKLKTYYSGGQFGDAGLLNDDIWAILALGAVNESGASEAQAAKDHLLSKQNEDGGWGYAVGGESDTNDTASAIAALIEAGLSVSDAAITKAINYLKAVQNSDGGFGWNAGSASDSGSDAWVIIALNKLGQSASDWDKSGNNPAKHLESLQARDGGYWWVAPGTSDFNNKAMTPYAVIALAGKSFPIARYSASAPQSGYHLRIEGANNTVCDAYAEAPDVLELVKNAAAVCNYTYNIKETSFGLYLETINSESAAGAKGWMYFVNFESPAVGMSDYALKEGDDVLVYYGDWGWMPLKLSASQASVQSGQSMTISASIYQNGQWQAAADADIKGLGQEIKADSSGKAVLALADGAYSVWAEKSGGVRSNRLGLTFGNGVGKSVALSAEIEAAPIVAGEALIFTVNPDALNFGKVKAGSAAKQSLSLKNEGTVDLNIKAGVAGDEVFTDFLQLNNQDWKNYSVSLNANATSSVEASLAVPQSYLQSGVKTGTLTIWASPK